MIHLPINLKTPRGIFRIHTVYQTMEEAEQAGWNPWFTFEGYNILTRDNTVGAVVKKEIE